MWALSDYSFLYALEETSSIEEVKMSPGVILLVGKRTDYHVELTVYLFSLFCFLCVFVDLCQFSLSCRSSQLKTENFSQKSSSLCYQIRKSPSLSSSVRNCWSSKNQKACTFMTYEEHVSYTVFITLAGLLLLVHRWAKVQR